MIEKIDVFKLAIPLKKPYILSYGEIDHFDTVIAVVNNKYAGAFTSLKGYFDNINIDDVYNEANRKSAFLVGKKITDCNSNFLGPLAIAIERMSLNLKIPKEVPVIKIINRDFSEILKGDFNYKIKVGLKDFENDILFAKAIINKISPKSKLRIDANQGFDLKKALRFISEIGTNFEYLEQPFPIEKWEYNKELIKKTGVKIMIDEAAVDIESIRKAKECGASFIKIKLAKFGSIHKAIEAMKFAEEAGLKAIIGNGVDVDTSNYLESIIWQQGATKMVGEMNGFLKPEMESKKMYLKDSFIHFTGAEELALHIPKEIIKEKNSYGK